jgi:SAM-dependent methyltransferase
MSMNIIDKARLYREIFRVLKPGARFVMFDPIRGRRGDVVFPAPWATRAEASSLVSESQMTAFVREGGFEITHTFNGTANGLAWYEQLAAAEVAQTPEARARAATRADPRFAVMMTNHRLNLESGAVEILGLVARKPD